MPRWLLDGYALIDSNKEWIFSGIGVTILIGVLSFIWKFWSLDKKARNNGESNRDVATVQSGGDMQNVTINLVQSSPGQNSAIQQTSAHNVHLISQQDFSDVTDLIEKIQEKQLSLSACIAEALSIAQTRNSPSLVNFCKQEMTGWEGASSVDELEYRVIPVFVSLNQINPNFVGWNGSTSNIINYMERNPKDFVPTQFLIPFPVSRLEQHIGTASEQSLMTLTMRLGDYMSDAKCPDLPLYAYCSHRTFQNLLEAIRQKLTKKLINLLPSTINAESSV